MNQLVAISTGHDEYRQSTDAAGLCRDIVLQTAKPIQGRQFVSVEGWQAIAIAHGCAAGARDVERIDGGVRAIGEVRRMSDGQVIATAEGFVGEDEPVWFGGTMKKWKWGQKRGEKVWYDETMPKRADYAIRAMAQTRAISRACRSAFAHVVVMIDAGLSTTPAEEVPDGGFVDGQYEEVQQERPSEPAKTSQPGGRITEEQLAKLQMLLKATKTDPLSFCREMGAPEGVQLFQMLQEKYPDALKLLETRLADMAKAETNNAAGGFGEELGDAIVF